jgi:putative flavoprotein involved in K+ transport
LKQAGVEHVVLEAERIGETWRSRRWDSFCLVTPNWSVQLPGAPSAGSDPDGFLNRDDLVEHLELWAHSFDAPIRVGCNVTSLDRENDHFSLQTGEGRFEAGTVVVASGGYQRAFMPPGSHDLPVGVTQLLAEEYRNPAALPPGAVLIVGSGQTGCQLAEELHEAGRRVTLACGRCLWAPRLMGGHDLVWWLIETGFADRTLADLPSPAARLFGNPQASGHGGGHDLHYRTLHELGVELVGRFEGADDGKVHFGELDAAVAGGDAMAAVLKTWIDALCKQQGLAIPWELPPPMHVDARRELDLKREGVGAVIWTTGFRPDYRWVHLPVFDDMGFPVQTDGRSEMNGLYFMGVHFQRKARSATLYGVRDDAEIVAGHIIENRR